MVTRMLSLCRALAARRGWRVQRSASCAGTLAHALAGTLLGVAAAVPLVLPSARAGDGLVERGGPDGAGALASSLASSSPPALAWEQRFGTCEGDEAYGVAFDHGGRVVVVGATGGSFAGPWAGAADAFVQSFDVAGGIAWQSQVGTGAWDVARAVAVDPVGRVVVVGGTEADLVGPNAGRGDAFVLAFGGAGELAWSTQFGTDEWDEAWAVAVDEDGAVVVVGSTAGALAGPRVGWSDAFVRRYDRDDRVMWQEQFGGDGDAMATGVAVDALGRVAISGRIESRREGETALTWDGVVRVYAVDGRELWDDRLEAGLWGAAWGVAVGADGRVAVAGAASGSLAGPSVGSVDAFVRVYDAVGGVVWEDRFGVGDWDEALGVSVTSDGGVVVVGRSRTGLAPEGWDRWAAFVRAYDGDGRLRWHDRFGDEHTTAWAVATDALGRVAVAGATLGDTSPPCHDWLDAFVRVYEAPPRESGGVWD